LPDDARVHLDVALERGGDQIRGTVDDGDGRLREFSGWLELMSAFDSARARAGDDETGSRRAPK
jgi:hypothetical protein